MNKMNLYNFIFWFNPHEDLWYAIDRDTQLWFFNGDRKKAIYYKSKDHSTLVSILMKDGLAEKLNKSKPEPKKKKV
jgi:hypothetical protein